MSNIHTVGTWAALKALEKSGYSTGDLVQIGGSASVLDGGGGTFVWSGASAATDDGGTVAAPNEGGTGRWIRQAPSGVTNVEAFGGFTQAAIEAAIAAGVRRILLPTGSKAVADLAIPTHVYLEGAHEQYTHLNVSGTADGLIVGGPSPTLAFSSQISRLRVEGDSTGTGISIFGANNAIRDVRVSMTNGTALDIQHCVICLLENVYLLGSVGIRFGTPSDVINIFAAHGVFLSGSATGLLFETTNIQPLYFRDATFDTITDLISGADDGFCRQIVFDGCWFESITNISSDRVGEIVFKNCAFIGTPSVSGRHPIIFDECHGDFPIARTVLATGKLSRKLNFAPTETVATAERVTRTNAGLISGRYATIEGGSKVSGTFTNLYDSTSELDETINEYGQPVNGRMASGEYISIPITGLDTGTKWMKFRAKIITEGAKLVVSHFASSGVTLNYSASYQNFLAADGWFTARLGPLPQSALGTQNWFQISASGGTVDIDPGTITICRGSEPPILAPGETATFVNGDRRVIEIIDASGGDTTADLMEAMAFGETYEVRLSETEAFDGDSATSFSLGDGSSADAFLSAVTADGSAVGYAVVSGTENVGLPLRVTVTNNGSASTGEITATVIVRR